MSTPSPSEDPDLKAAQLEKLRAETEKLRAEKSKLEQEAAVLPRQASGSYWSEVIKILGAVVLGVGGVVTATGSYFTAKNQVELAEMKARQAEEKRNSAELGAETAKIETAKALQLRDTARKEQAEAEKSVRELRETLTELTTKVRAANPELVPRRLVYIQFQGDLPRSMINELRKSLETGGFTAPGAERVAGNYRNLVKYFRSEDQVIADTLRKKTEEFFASRGCPVQLRVIPAQATATAPLEVWLSHSCKQ